MPNDDLITEIEQFLAAPRVAPGEPPEPTAEEQALAAFEAFREAAQPIIDAFVEAFQPLWDAIVRVCRRVVGWLASWHIGLRRDQLRAKLEAWRLPRPVATWLANRCPVRWLPAFVLPPPEIV